MSPFTRNICLGIVFFPLVAMSLFLYWASLHPAKSITLTIPNPARTKASGIAPPEINLASDLIDEWEKKTLGPVWMNGIYTPISLRGTASVEDVLQTLMSNSLGSRTYRILGSRHYGPKSIFPNGAVILYETERGDRTIFATYYEGKNSWWYRVYAIGL